MRFLAKSLFLLGATALVVHPSITATLFRDSQFNVKVARNVQYGSGEVRQPKGAKRPLYLDMYQPDSSDFSWKRPVMIALHGGGFLFGDKSEMADLCRE